MNKSNGSDEQIEVAVPLKSGGFLQGFSSLLIATVIAGVAGYIVTWLIYREVGPAQYAQFAIFWSALYLIIGGLSGIQQEVTRGSSTRRIIGRSTTPVARTFTVLAAALITILILATAPLWSIGVFGASWMNFSLPLALGAGSYVVVAVISGSLYGVSNWMLLALSISLDAIIRLVLVSISSLFMPELKYLTWAVVIPFFLVPLLLLHLLFRALKNKVTLDVGLRELSWNSARTVLAAMTTALIVSGYPLLLGLTASNIEASLMGELIFVITITRAPLIVIFTALQSFFLIRFKVPVMEMRKNLFLILAVVMGITVLVSIISGFIGVEAFQLITNREMSVSGLFISLLVISSGIIACLSVTGAALLSRSKHSYYLFGWVCAGVLTVMILMLPVSTTDKVELSLIAPPLLGLVVHILGIAKIVKDERSAPVEFSVVTID